MSENNAAAEQQAGPQFAIQRIYTKDISFEAPNTPAVFTEKWEPKINVDLNTAANALAEGLFEIELHLTVTATLGDKTAYLVEVKQAGIFAIGGFNEADTSAMVHSYCPNVLFPFAREVIADVVTKASFPQMLLAPINFDALYAQHLQQQQAQQGAEQVTGDAASTH